MDNEEEALQKCLDIAEDWQIFEYLVAGCRIESIIRLNY